MYSANDWVELVNNPAEKGIIYRITDTGYSKSYHVQWFNGNGITILREDEIRLTTNSNDPWANMVNQRIYHRDDFITNTIYHKVKNSVDNTLSSLKASKTLFKPHQYIPLMKLLKYQQKRLLIADEVGLGKTIEAGHILMELFARQMVSRVLVICTKTLVEKWINEMSEKFAFSFRELDSKSFMQEFGSVQQPEEYYGVINYDKFSANQNLRKFVVDQTPHFDLVICDEAQALRNRSTKRFGAIQPIIDKAKHVVFLSATPINNKLEDLYNLLTLLDPVRYFDKTSFEYDQAINRPFIDAINSLRRGTIPSEVAETLKQREIRATFTYGDEVKYVRTTVEDRFSDTRLYNRVIERMTSGDTSIENLVRINNDLTELNTLNNLFTRTKKRDVEGGTSIRTPYTFKVQLSDEESEAYERELKSLEDRYSHLDNPTFPVMVKCRQFASSLPAYLKKEYNTILKKDSKLEVLARIIEEVVKTRGKKLIIFAEFKETLRYIRAYLDHIKIGAALITGDNPNERGNILAKFQHDSQLSVLLASRVGTEGIDLQFCDAIVNYDLPWNPMVLEQRIGRIDRIGQESERIHIYNMVIENTIEEYVYDRLLNKINIFESSIGILESILADEETLSSSLENLEFKFYAKKLTDAELKAQIDQMAISIENEKVNVEKIDNELTDAMVQDHYFKEEIERIRTNERYLTPKNLSQYVTHLISSRYRSINVVSREMATLVLDIPESMARQMDNDISVEINAAPQALRTHLHILYSDFKRLLINGGKVKLCFDSEMAFKDKRIHYVSPYHPLIYLATKIHEKEQANERNAFNLQLNLGGITSDFEPGYYVLSINKLTIKKKWYGQQRVNSLMYPVVIDLNSEEPRILGQEQSEQFFKLCQHNASHAANPLPTNDAAAFDLIRDQVVASIDNQRLSLQDDESVKLESTRQRYTMQVNDYYNWQVEVRNRRLQNEKGIVNIIQSEIDKLETEREAKLNEIADSGVTANGSEFMVAWVEVK